MRYGLKLHFSILNNSIALKYLKCETRIMKDIFLENKFGSRVVKYVGN
jgi:hypothetical protein